MISSFLNVGTEAADGHSPRPYSARFYHAPSQPSSPYGCQRQISIRPDIPGRQALISLHRLVYPGLQVLSRKKWFFLESCRKTATKIKMAGFTEKDFVNNEA
jgi:hypothetical protein